MRPGPEAALRGRRRAARRAGQRAAAPPSGASGRIQRSDVRARVPLLAPAPASFQVVLRDGRYVHVVVRSALNVDGIDVLILEIVLSGLGLAALDVIVEPAIRLRLRSARLNRRAGLVDVEVLAGIGQRRTNALAVGLRRDSYGLNRGFVRVVLELGPVLGRLLTVLSAAADVVGALLRQRLVRREAAVARTRQRGIRATAAAREDGGATPGRHLFLVAALRLFLREFGLRADVD